jgi:hypothetical protein
MKLASATALQTCCATRRDLGKQFAIAARLHAEAVVVLTLAVPPVADFEESCSAVEQARQLCEAASAAFREHVIAHRCWGGNADAL